MLIFIAETSFTASQQPPNSKKTTFLVDFLLKIAPYRRFEGRSKYLATYIFSIFNIKYRFFVEEIFSISKCIRFQDKWFSNSNFDEYSPQSSIGLGGGTLFVCISTRNWSWKKFLHKKLLEMIWSSELKTIFQTRSLACEFKKFLVRFFPIFDLYNTLIPSFFFKPFPPTVHWKYLFSRHMNLSMV